MGIIFNNEMTFRHYLYGNDEHDGLIAQLKKRVGILYRLSKQMSPEKLKTFAMGLFYSKLSYCLPVFGHVFGLERYKDNNSR